MWEGLHRVLLDRLGEADRIDWERASLDSASVPAMISRTVGLPGLPAVEEWLEPLGLLSLLVESLFVGLWLMTFAPIPSRIGDKNSPS